MSQGQHAVEPIRDPEQIRAMKEYLLHRSYRSRWQNLETGEIIETDEVIKKNA
jgi:hypothetical protein